MILEELLVKVIIFQLLRKYRRTIAITFDKYDFSKHLNKPLLKICEITRIQQKHMIFRGQFGKATIFELFKKVQ